MKYSASVLYRFLVLPRLVYLTFSFLSTSRWRRGKPALKLGHRHGEEEEDRTP